MTYRLLVGVLLSLSCAVASADIRELIDEPVLAALAAETSGEAAKRNLDSITLQHRMRSGTQFDAATQYIHETLLHYGLDDVEFVTFAADGETMYGTQKSRPVWKVEFAQLWEVRESDGGIERVRKLADWDAAATVVREASVPVFLAGGMALLVIGVSLLFYALTIPFERVLIVDEQVTGEHFAEDTLTFEAGACDGVECLFARDVHDVHRAVEHFGNSNRAVRGFAFDRRRP